MLRALNEYSKFLKSTSNSYLQTDVNPVNLEDDNQYTEQLINDINIVLYNRRYEEPIVPLDPSHPKNASLD